jgi:amino acid adenylation domain-containing protein
LDCIEEKMDKKRFALHLSQEDVYLDQLLNLDSPLYNIGGYIKIKGKLNFESFISAVSSTPAVFDAYRMRFDFSDSQPVFYLDNNFEKLEIELVDFTQASFPEKEAEVWMQNQFNAVFDFESQNPLFEHYLLKINENENWFFGKYHHLITDGYGFNLFIEYISNKYKSLVVQSNQIFNYPSYLIEAANSVNYLTSAKYDDDKVYWSDRLNSKPNQLFQKKYTLSKDQKSSQSFVKEIKPGLLISLNKVSKLAGCSNQQLLIAALSIYLSRTYQNPVISIGVPIHKRISKHLRKIVGMFSGILNLKLTIDDELSLKEFLLQIASTQAQDYRHLNFPAAEISRLQKVNPMDGFLHQVVTSYEPLNFELDFGDDLNVIINRLDNEFNQNPLQLSWREYNKDQTTQLYLNFMLEYFNRHEIELLSSRLVFILEQFEDSLNKSLKTISVLPQAELVLIKNFNHVHDFNANQLTIVDLFEQQVAFNPNAEALIFENEIITYQQLEDSSNQLANYLIQLGATVEDLVPICFERGTNFIIAILGVLKAGASYVPIDSAYPKNRINFIIKDSKAKLVLSDLLESDDSYKVINLKIEELKKYPSSKPITSLQPSNRAYVIYTSGSTGKPKGVEIEHQSVVNLIKSQSEYFKIDSADRILQFSHPSFDASVEQIFLALSNGASLILFKEGLQIQTNEFEHFLNIHKVTHLHATPGFLENLKLTNLTHLKRIIAGGDYCNLSLAKKWPNNLDFFNEYGPTETTVTAIEYKFETEIPNKFLPIGKGLKNSHIYVLNHSLDFQPIGIPGEIYIGGVQVARGYLNNPSLTNEHFIKDPFDSNPHSRLYRTGDLGRWLPDGNLEFIGRVDDQVKIRGYRIELGEIETALLESAMVTQAVVIASQDAQNNKRLVAYVVPNQSQGYTKESLIHHLKETLPEYMVPALWVELTQLPLTQNGKIDKKSLPDPDLSELTENTYVAPRNATEQKLSEIWQALLGIERIGIHHNFFELGGHSLLAMRVISQIRKELELDISVKDIFRYPTISELASCLYSQNKGLLLPSIGKIERPEYIPLSFSQERLWFIDRLEGSVQYHMPSVLRLKGHLEIEYLEQSIGEIINRHEVLRTVIGEYQGEAYQQIKPLNGWHLEKLDGSDYQTNSQALAQKIDQLTRKPFDLSKDYMLRASLIELAAEDHILVVTIHHIASDGWSISVMVRELVEHYSAYQQKRASRLPKLDIQYADYALWQRKYLQGEILDSKLNYWKEKLQDVTPLELPTDYSRPAIAGNNGAVIEFKIDKEQSNQLQQLSQNNQVTLFMTLLSAIKVLLYRYSGQQDICVGSPIASRQQHEVEGLIGFFLNTLALRSELKDEQSFTDLLQEVKATTLEAYEHQDVPLEKVVEAVVKQRDMGRNPLFEVLFVLQNTPEVPELQLGDLVLTNEGYSHTTAQFDLSISINETKDGLIGNLEYKTDLYDEATIKKLLAHFENLISSILQTPDETISKLALLSKEEEIQLLNVFNHSDPEIDTTLSVIDLFEARANLQPKAIALEFANQEMTYEELSHKSNLLANHLIESGVVSEMIIPVLIERSMEMVVAILGILKSGAAFVPIDPTYPIERIQFMLEDCDAKLVLSSKLSHSILESQNQFEIIEIEAILNSNLNKSIERPKVFIPKDALAYIIYTSGSTGKPKGAMIEHDSFSNYVQVHRNFYELKPDDFVIQQASLSFDVSLEEIFPCLVSGGTVGIVRDGGIDIETIKSYIQSGKATMLTTTPMIVEILNQELTDIGRLRILIASGDVLHSSFLDFFIGKVSIINGYGPTETTIGVSRNRFKDIRDASLIGKPNPNNNIYILSPSHALVPVGVSGEICIGGCQVGRGYLNREELTKQKFVNDPFIKNGKGRMYKTGDKARWLPDGRIEFQGRIDDQVKIRGFRIELGEIENVLQQSVFVKQAVVLARNDFYNVKHLIAYIVPDENVKFDKELLVQYLAEKLPEYMVPALWVEMESIPISSNGKIDKKSLPDPDLSELTENTYVAPRNATEQKLSEIWQTLLGIERIGVHHNFFELGGHSLLAMRVISQIRKELELDISVKDIFRYPTISELASCLYSQNKGLLLPSIGKIERPEYIPLSFSQERLWFIDRLEGSVQYHMPSVLRLKGHLEIEYLEQSIGEIINRHEVLRTVIGEYQGEAYQQIKPLNGWHLEKLDGSDYQTNSQALAQKIDQLTRKPFDLSKDYMLRASLIELAAEDHILVVTIHHIASDGWSISVMVRELVEHYSAYQQKRASRLPKLDIQYADYALWQRKYLQGEILDSKLNYWKEKLQDVTPLELPTDYSRPAIAGNNGAVIEFKIDKEQSNQLQQLSQNNQVTLFMTLLSAIKVLLYRYSGQQDICVGSPIASRQQHEVEGLIGFFLNTLALRSELKDEQSFTDLLQEVKATTLEAYEHQDVPLEKVVEAVVKQRDMGRNPLFEVLFVLQNTPEVPELQLGDLVLTNEGYSHTTAQFDLSISINETKDGLIGNLEYKTDLYDEATIKRMIDHLKTLLNSIVKSPDRKISRLNILSREEEAKLKKDFNNTRIENNSNQSIVDLFEKQVKVNPQNIAVEFENQQLTYRELNEKANKVAHYLQKQGAKSEMLIGICIDRSLEMIVGVLGILKLGATYVPIDPEYPQSRIDYLVENTKTVHIICNGSTKSKFSNKPELSLIALDTDWQKINFESDTNLNIPILPEYLVYILHTSGSTGIPKGVKMSNAAVSNLLLWQQKQFNNTPRRVLQFAALNFDVSFQEIFSTLCFGNSLILISSERRTDISEVLKDVALYEITHLFIPCIVLKSIAELFSSAQSVSNSLEEIIVAGEQLKLTNDIKTMLASKNIRLTNQYGPTESHVVTSFVVNNNSSLFPSIGKPIDNTRIYILRGQKRLSPIGIPGEIYIGGVQVARGYLNNPSLTNEHFIKDPFDSNPHSRLYRTGDLGRWLPDGNLEFIGRVDDQVKIRGYRIELGEIETALLESAMVTQAVVIASQDAQNNKRLVAYVVPNQSQGYTKESLIHHLKETLPEYMVPALWVELAQLPLTQNGKIDKKSLPDPDLSELTENTYVAPRNATEQKLSEIWQALLGIERIGIHHNFFELGGHSLLAMRVISQIRKELELDISVKDIFRYPTISELASCLYSQNKGLLLPSIGKIERPEYIPLSFSQERLWFIDRLEGSVQYHMPSVLRLKGHLEIEYLEQSIGEIINRHEVLRTVIGEYQGEAYQQIKPLNGWHLEKLDGSDYQTNSQALSQKIDQLTRKPFDLSKDYMLRASLIHLAAEDHILVVTIHHIASDGWSISVMVRELVEHYSAYQQKRASSLPKLDIQYADYALWQRKYLQGEILDSKLNYWKEKLQDVTPLELPTDYSRPAIAGNNGAVIEFKIDKEQSNQLQQLSQNNQVTLFMTLLSAIKVLLYRYSGQQDICVGSPIASRQQHEVEGLIGFFLNTLALRSELKDEQSFTDLLQEVKATTLEAYEHQDVPLEKVVEAVVKQRDMGRNPLFEVLFVLQNTPEVPELQLGDISLEIDKHILTISKFDLNFGVQETANGLECKIEYKTELFKDSTIHRLISHFKNLLSSVVTSPNEKIGLLQMLGSAEERQLKTIFNNTKATYPKSKTIIDLFEEQVQKNPNAIATIFEQNQLTYADLNQKANQLAHFIEANYSVTKNLKTNQSKLIGLYLDRSLEMVIGMLAVLKTGAAYVPIDIDYPQSRVDFILKDAGVELVLTKHHLIREDQTQIAVQNILCIDLSDEIYESNTIKNLNNSVSSSDLAYVIYTSGTTGNPKGVMIEQKSVVAKIEYLSKNHKIDSSFKIGSKIPYSFDPSVREIFLALLTGSQLVIISSEIYKDTDKLLNYSITTGINLLIFVPSHLNIFLESLKRSEPYQLALMDLKLIYSCGEILHPETVKGLRSYLPNLVIKNQYGPTEACLFSFEYEILPDSVLPESIPVGKVIDNTKAYVLSPSMELVPLGVMGELFISGPGLAKGYLNLPELTTSRFVSNPFVDAKEDDYSRLYRTGDLGRWLPDGNLEFIGRVDDQVKIRGYRIELGEIETALLESAMVTQAVVIASQDAQNNKRLVAYVVPNQSQGYTKESLIHHLKETLPEYMVPALWVELAQLPLTQNGKIDKKSLPDPDLSELTENTYVAPRNATEQKLSEIWQALLGIERIGIHHNFFELGGHSLLAMRVISQIRKELELDISVKDIFRYPTISELASCLYSQNKGLLLPSIGKIERPEYIPLSFSQERLWFIDRLEGSVQYHMPSVLRLKGHLEIEYLEQSIGEIINRHEVLRTVIGEYQGEAYQQIKPLNGWHLEKLDGSDYQTNSQALSQKIDQLTRKPFDLSKDYMLRASLIHLAAEDHILVVTIHHIASDGWSISVMVRELVEHYSAYQQKRASSLPKLDIQYADYALWQRKYLQGEILDSKLNYWKEKLQDVTPLELPTDYSRPAIAGNNGAVIEFKIDKEQSNQLQQLSQNNQVTLFMTLLSAIKVLLYRYSGQQDICVGSPIASRQQHEVEGLIGFFLNTLALRSELKDEQSFTDLLQEVKATTLEAYEHQDVPLEKVVEAVVKQRDMGRNPLFEVLFVLQNTPEVPELQLGDLVLKHERTPSRIAKFDLNMSLTQTSEGLVGSLEYKTELFNESTIQRMIDHFKALLNSILDSPDQQIGVLEMLNANERNQLLKEFNNTKTDFPKELTLIDLFEQQVIKCPQSIAVKFKGQALTYEELNEKANQLANYLQGKGVKAEMLVPIFIERSFEMIIGILGVLKSGAAYVPIDPEYPRQRVEFILKDVEAKFLLTSTGLENELKELKTVEIINLETDWNIISQQLASNPKLRATAENVAYVIYTSGSTGNPKGVINEHQGVVNRLIWGQNYFNLNAQDKVLHKTTYSFDVSVWELFWPLISGARLIIAEPKKQKESSYIKQIIETERISLVHFVPSMLDVFINDLNEQDVFPSVKFVLCSGEAMKSSHVEAFKNKLPDIELHNLYGPTEAAIEVTHQSLQVLKSKRLVPIGKPLANTQIHILNAAGKMVPIGVAGEIHIGGKQVARGYWKNDSLTNEKFIKDPFTESKKARLYKTGDTGRWLPDGSIEYLGRNDEQVKIRGFRIELGEIETLLEKEETIKQAIVLAKEDHTGNKRLVAYLVVDNQFDKELTIRHLSKQLPEYMLPSIWVQIESIPVNSNGKVDKKALPEPDLGENLYQKFVAPESEIEVQIANIWKGLLNLEEISVHDNFFDLGGHSLMALRIISAIRKQLRTEIEIIDLVNNPTVYGLSKLVETYMEVELNPKSSLENANSHKLL